MKKICIIISLISLISTNALSQNELEVYSYASDEYLDIFHDLPVVREINGGTVIRITYEGDWTNEMKGAFEYACKIWEEKLPAMLPLNITAKIARIRDSSGKKTLSKVSPIGHNIRDTYNYELLSLKPQVKYVILKEYHNTSPRQFYERVRDSTYFDEPDMLITYNQALLDEFSFSLSPKQTDKYDFVTIALRDIAKGLGICCDCYTYDNKLIFRNQYLTRYEFELKNKLGATDSVQGLQNAKGGDVRVCGYKLYTPETWEQGLSLNAFVPEEEDSPIQLLSYEFGKGTIIRDLQEFPFMGFATGYLGWFDLVTISIGNAGGESISGSTDAKIPFAGCNIPVEDGAITKSHHLQADSINRKMVSLGNYSDEFEDEDDEENYHFHEYYDEYLWKYNHNTQTLYPMGDKRYFQCTAALLKKDGTWDIVKHYAWEPQLTISTSDFELHEPIENYARTPDGFLRCRVTNTGASGKYGIKNLYRVKYYVVESLPQKIELSYSGLYNEGTTYKLMNSDDEYLRDVKIGLKNLEGADRIVVEQLDEGDAVPFRYEVTDFKDGYFIATVDKEFYSSFTVIAYNNNGSTRSETFTLAPLEPWEETSYTSILHDKIDITALFNGRRKFTSDLNYDIIRVSPYDISVVQKGKTTMNETINISSLSTGTYILKLELNGNVRSMKFRKE